MWDAKPWESEPNFARYTARGFSAVIRRNSVMGHLMGFVGVDRLHPCYGIRTESEHFPSLVVTPHAGWAYPNHTQDPKTHLPSDLWWVGFEAKGRHDYLPILDDFPDSDVAARRGGLVYRTFEFMRQEIDLLASGLEAVARLFPAPGSIVATVHAPPAAPQLTVTA